MTPSRAIITGYDEDFARVGGLCSASWANYAIIQGWKFHKLSYPLVPCRHPSWMKVEAIRSFLTVYDQVFWVDADSVVVDMDIKTDFPNQWYSSLDGYGLCTSHFCVRRTVDVMRLLDAMITLGDPLHYRDYHDQRKHEQDTLKTLVHNFASVRDMIDFMPAELIQHGKVLWPGCLALHVPCLPLAERYQILSNV